ncbi:transcriptional adapter 2-beta [Lates japonicus]|uniref:Transcriptional adapter 2-beta n=1 Tax=Lates japonicus TaxID=270547 RepID=A0AAD3M3W4_LATJO|nr:transcriptional adapter 2-beta [Lates japonicus]
MLRARAVFEHRHRCRLSMSCAQVLLKAGAKSGNLEWHDLPGRWAAEDMATHAGASQTPQEVMEHYVTMYIHETCKACIPDSIPNCN